MITLFETKLKTVPITKQMVKEAYRKVLANKGSEGIDEVSLEDYQKDLLGNLYKLWNRLSSGSYFPKPVREVMIPKADGSKRKLGIPTINDRIAQQVIKTYLEPRLEKVFHEHSYGYRPSRSAHDAVDAVRKNVKQYWWVIDIDIKSFFDEVSHELLLKALDCHVEEKWIKLYIKRWLEVPSQQQDGTLIPKDGKGTPQGGVISPLLSNLFLHYVLDKWLTKQYRYMTFVRYADDVIIHCYTEHEAKKILEAVRQRLGECHLRLNEEKTKLVYCQTSRRADVKCYTRKFDFLGFTFKPQTSTYQREGKYVLFLGYDCMMSQKSKTRILEGWKQMKLNRQSSLTIQEIATMVEPQMRGIIRYYGKFNRWKLQRVMWYFQRHLVKWALNRYKRFKRSHDRAYQWLKQIKQQYPNMFYHWIIFPSI
jgi:group II intron reverse transcriptase/maturase